MKDMVDVEFPGNVRVTRTQHEIRIWVCNDQGQNIFRFKALGEIHGTLTNERGDVIIVPKGRKDG